MRVVYSMNIQDREDDKIVIMALADYYTELKARSEVLSRNWGDDKPSARAADKSLAEIHEKMRRINAMLGRWTPPEE